MHVVVLNNPLIYCFMLSPLLKRYAWNSAQCITRVFLLRFVEPQRFRGESG